MFADAVRGGPELANGRIETRFVRPRGLLVAGVAVPG
jgi:hypothetical protein